MARPDDRPYVIDLIAPLFISRGLFTRAAGVLGTTTSSTLALGRSALQAVIDAANGALELSEQRATIVKDSLANLDDDVIRMRIHQRLALAAYYRGDSAHALDDAAEGIRLARLLKANRFACHLYAVVYATHYTWAGDFEAAWGSALAIEREATLGGDASHRALARVARYELAAERGDSTALASIRASIEAEPLPEQYRERFAAGIADALRLAWSGEFATCRNILIVLKDTSGRTDGERALCRGLLALTAVALGDDDAARRFSRQAISNSARPARSSVAYELRYRRLARAMAAVAGDMIGDIVRGRRAVEARFLQGDPSIASLIKMRPDVALEDVPTDVRGYAKMIQIVSQRFEMRPSNGPLTPTEIDILKLVTKGRNAPEIAALLGRSAHTVRTHLRNASAKLETHGRVEMIARARQLGLLADS
jgi:DNA-binding CsgD family transcriptional regulator